MMMYRVILHWSVYYPDHKKRNFAIHINQYNDLTLRIFLSPPCLTTKVNDTPYKYPCFAPRVIHHLSAGHNPICTELTKNTLVRYFIFNVRRRDKVSCPYLNLANILYHVCGDMSTP